MRATVRDVATLAGVSAKTVSNVINGVVPVRPATRERVEAALRELDYVPNMSARGLRNGRTGVIALALPDLATAYSAELAKWFVESAHDRGWAVQIEQSGENAERELELISRARTHLVDGLVLNPTTLMGSGVRGDHGPLPPTVVIGEVEPQGVDQVHVDSRRAAREMTEHLIGLGHRRIAIVGASDDTFRSATSELRQAGHEDALRAAGIPVDPTLAITATSWSSGAGAAFFARFLDHHELPDAVFCFTDSMALGVLSVLADRGVDVPGRVSVAGFDDIQDAAFAVPALTSVSFDKRAIALAALTALERRIEDATAEREVVVIPHRIVTRASTAPRA
ncbi:LacI family DNA-binding transcriptional regulator [Curtobacterium sp. RRHDQ10]|uniref:LacI family DNA-binding transcriptional regulator n=1 Tax=Curtobacterium phyllosphaerae TaxID=3413379 RepID=UPI003BF13F04